MNTWMDLHGETPDDTNGSEKCDHCGEWFPSGSLHSHPDDCNAYCADCLAEINAQKDGEVQS